MSWIKEIKEEDAEGLLAKAYRRVQEKRGKLSNVMRAQSLMPEAMLAHLDLYLALMFDEDDGITREQRELIGTVVSALNDCRYCVEHHSTALNFYWPDRDRIKELVQTFEIMELPVRDRRLVDYAVKLTRKPSEMTENDINALRDADFSDKDILRATMIVGYFNFVNRLVLGLGIEHSKEEIEGYKY